MIAVARYRENLSKDQKLKITVVTSEASAREILATPGSQIEVLVIDNAITNVFDLVKELRQTYPRLMILVVDEEADFGTPGRADDISTEPFKDDDLIKKIKRLSEERGLETLRADALPSVRNFAKLLSKASKSVGKQQAAVDAIKELGYDYVAYYSVATTTPPSLTLATQLGAEQITVIAPNRLDYNNTLPGLVAQVGQSRIASPEEKPNFQLVEKGKFGAVACVPVGSTLRFGVLVACREQSGSIKMDSVLMLELIAAQLASALAKEQRG
jgi:hypothetical protein